MVLELQCVDAVEGPLQFVYLVALFPVSDIFLGYQAHLEESVQGRISRVVIAAYAYQDIDRIVAAHNILREAAAVPLFDLFHRISEDPDAFLAAPETVE